MSGGGTVLNLDGLPYIYGGNTGVSIGNGPGLVVNEGTIIGAGHGNPFAVTSVRVDAGTVTLDGTIDLQSLLGL